MPFGRPGRDKEVPTPSDQQTEFTRTMAIRTRKTATKCHRALHHLASKRELPLNQAGSERPGPALPGKGRYWITLCAFLPRQGPSVMSPTMIQDLQPVDRSERL